MVGQDVNLAPCQAIVTILVYRLNDLQTITTILLSDPLHPTSCRGDLSKWEVGSNGPDYHYPYIDSATVVSDMCDNHAQYIMSLTCAHPL